MSRADRASERRSETRPALQRKRRPTIKASSGTPLVFGHFRRGTNVKPEVDAWIAAQRLNRLAQAAVAEAMAPLTLW